MEVAKAKLRDLSTELQKTARASAAQDRGRMSLGDCATILRQQRAGCRGVVNGVCREVFRDHPQQHARHRVLARG